MARCARLAASTAQTSYVVGSPHSNKRSQADTLTAAGRCARSCCMTSPPLRKPLHEAETQSEPTTICVKGATGTFAECKLRSCLIHQVASGEHVLCGPAPACATARSASCVSVSDHRSDHAGYIAGSIIQRLLADGHTMHATVRDPAAVPKRAPHLTSLPASGERLTLFQTRLTEALQLAVSNILPALTAFST